MGRVHCEGTSWCLSFEKFRRDVKKRGDILSGISQDWCLSVMQRVEFLYILIWVNNSKITMAFMEPSEPNSCRFVSSFGTN